MGKVSVTLYITESNKTLIVWLLIILPLSQQYKCTPQPDANSQFSKHKMVADILVPPPKSRVFCSAMAEDFHDFIQTILGENRASSTPAKIHPMSEVKC